MSCLERDRGHIYGCNRSGQPNCPHLFGSYRQDGKVRKWTLANLSKWAPELIEQFQQLLQGARTIDKPEEAFAIRNRADIERVKGTYHNSELG